MMCDDKRSSKMCEELERLLLLNFFLGCVCLYESSKSKVIFTTSVFVKK